MFKEGKRKFWEVMIAGMPKLFNFIIYSVKWKKIEIPSMVTATSLLQYGLYFKWI